MIEVMRIICAWCKKDMGLRADPDDQRTSHGICQSCRKHLEASTEGIPLREFLDSLNVPVTLVDVDHRVVYANRAAEDVLKKPLAAIERNVTGRVFECDDSYRPEGCGRAPACSACALWNAVTRCHQSGQAEEGLVATLTQRNDDGTSSVAMRISTARVDDLVVLRIDELPG